METDWLAARLLNTPRAVLGRALLHRELSKGSDRLEDNLQGVLRSALSRLHQELQCRSGRGNKGTVSGVLQRPLTPMHGPMNFVRLW